MTNYVSRQKVTTILSCLVDFSKELDLTKRRFSNLLHNQETTATILEMVIEKLRMFSELCIRSCGKLDNLSRWP